MELTEFQKDITKLIPFISKREYQFFLKFLLKYNIYNLYLHELKNALKVKDSSYNHIFGTQAILAIVHAEQRGDITRKLLNIHIQWQCEYKEKFGEKILEDWNNHILNIMVECKIDIKDYLEKEKSLLVPAKKIGMVRKYIDKRFPHSLMGFYRIIKINVRTYFNGWKPMYKLSFIL